MSQLWTESSGDGLVGVYIYLVPGNLSAVIPISSLGPKSLASGKAAVFACIAAQTPCVRHRRHPPLLLLLRNLFFLVIRIRGHMFLFWICEDRLLASDDELSRSLSFPTQRPHQPPESLAPRLLLSSLLFDEQVWMVVCSNERRGAVAV